MKFYSTTQKIILANQFTTFKAKVRKTKTKQMSLEMQLGEKKSASQRNTQRQIKADGQ